VDKEISEEANALLEKMEQIKYKRLRRDLR
jgi:hypothetical protein